MKSIELTEEHKSKILEMCKALFPNDEFSWEYEMYGRGLKEEFNDVLCVFHKLDEPIKHIHNDKEYIQTEIDFNIHWFEFCTTHLFEKIFVKPSGYESIDDYISMTGSFLLMNSSSVSFHPVDYLYAKFKTL